VVNLINNAFHSSGSTPSVGSVWCPWRATTHEPMLRTTLAIVALSAPASAHYEDPNKRPGCAADEQKASITGIPGNLCIPPCDKNGTCPTDMPTGVTATPKCVLHDQAGDNYCALVCTPKASAAVTNDECGPHASCKPGGAPPAGLCTYDDEPPPPSSKHWVPVVSPTFQQESAVIAVAFEKAGKVGYAGAGENGIGAQIIKSEDAGVTWKQVFPAAGAPPAFNIFLAASCKPNSAIITGALDQMYSTDGNTFNASRDAFVTPSQDSGILPGGTYGIVTEGEGGKKNGVATSVDGKVWKFTTDLGLPDAYGARYAAFPTDDTWYVTAGTWPENENRNKKNKGAGRAVTSRIRVSDEHKMEVTHERKGLVGGAGPDDGYYAAIMKTTDGGKTWTSVYRKENAGIYPNGIHCHTTMHCVAVLEGERAKILVTRDGGTTWKETMNDEDKDASLMAVFMIDGKEGWAAGGHMSLAAFEGRYWHTLDGGDTWTKEAIPGLYIMSFDMVSKDSGFSVALTIESGVQLLKYRHNATKVVSLQ
jgi:photosystem II stability/assembly factor-like uncharacterized protein